MSTYIWPGCGHEEHLFGSGGGERMATENDIVLLGRLPLDTTIREGVDQGRPSVAVAPDSPSSAIYVGIARRLTALLSQRGRDYSAKFPRIVVKNEA